MNEVALSNSAHTAALQRMPAEKPRTAEEILQQVNLIKSIMEKVMKKDEHYGIIPGCSKPSLWKPGAEKLGLTFRLKPQCDITITPQGDGHNEYKVLCQLITADGEIAGEGIGICSTMEGKYRYRTEKLDVEIPAEYWKTKEPSLLGGPDCFVKKADNKWVIYRRIDQGNPADNYNTCIKMAKKRAFIDAILTTTAASDIFSAENGEDTEEAAKKRNGKNSPGTPDTIFDFATAKEKIEHGENFNGKLYKGGIIYINRDKYQVTEDQYNYLKELVAARTNETQANNPDFGTGRLN